jgi:hypothetical protein
LAVWSSFSVYVTRPCHAAVAQQEEEYMTTNTAKMPKVPAVKHTAATAVKPQPDRIEEKIRLLAHQKWEAAANPQETAPAIGWKLSEN